MGVGEGVGEVGGLIELGGRVWVDKSGGVVVGLSSGFATEVGFPGLGFPGVEQDSTVLVLVTVLYLNSVFVFVLKMVMYEGTGWEELIVAGGLLELVGGGQMLPKLRAATDTTHDGPPWLSWARAMAARKRVKNTP